MVIMVFGYFGHTKKSHKYKTVIIWVTSAKNVYLLYDV